MAICLNPQCRHVNTDDSKFCVKCGSALLLLQRYRALKVLGQGGFGITYLAQDEAKPSKPRCVTKQFSYLGPGQAKAAELFEAEAVQLDNLGKHPQIPELYAHCQQNGQQFLVQEFIDGQDLEKELQTEGAFDETKIRALLLDVLPVLDFIHQQKVIHRDIKPANMIRRRGDGLLVLVDFGAAKQASLTALQKTGTFIGSAEYTAPEQTRGKAVCASDLYSLGVTCLYLLTGVNPFDLKSLDDEWVWRDFLGGRSIDPQLAAILDRMLLPVSKRYGSAQEVLAELSPSTAQHASALPNPQPVTKTASQFFEDGRKKQESGDYQGAIADYTEAIRLQPNYAVAYNGRGLAKSESGGNRGAIADHTAAIRLQPDDAVAYKRRGNAKSKLGDKQGAVEDYGTAATLFERQGDQKSAEAARNRIQESALPNPQPVTKTAFQFFKDGWKKQESGDKQGAIADYTAAIRLQPDYAVAYKRRGLAKSQSGDNRGAVEDCGTAATLFERQGDQKSAEAVRNRIQEIENPSNIFGNIIKGIFGS